MSSTHTDRLTIVFQVGQTCWADTGTIRESTAQPRPGPATTVPVPGPHIRPMGQHGHGTEFGSARWWSDYFGTLDQFPLFLVVGSTSSMYNLDIKACSFSFSPIFPLSCCDSRLLRPLMTPILLRPPVSDPMRPCSHTPNQGQSLLNSSSSQGHSLLHSSSPQGVPTALATRCRELR